MTTDLASSAATREPIARQLGRDWLALRRRPDVLAHAAGWQIVRGQVDDLDQVLAACGFGARSRGDTELRDLVCRAAHDPLAGRVVLQRLLPPLAALARRRGPGALDELVGAAWIAISTFDPARRPASLAAALVADADHHAHRRLWRRAQHRDVVGIDGLDAVPAAPAQPAPDDEVAELLAAAAGSIDAGELALVNRLLAGESTDQIAADSGVSARTVRYRRARLTARLRDLAAAA